MRFVYADLAGGISQGQVSGNPEWFDRLSAQMQAAYLKQHIRSKFKQTKQAQGQPQQQQSAPPQQSHHQNIMNTILNGFKSTPVETIRTTSKEHANDHEVEQLQKLARPDPFEENLKNPHDEDDVVDHQDDEAEHIASQKIKKSKKPIPKDAIHIIKNLVLGVLIAAGVGAALALTHPAVAIHSALFIYHQATSEHLIESVWNTMVYGDVNVSPTDLIVNKMYNAVGNGSIADGHLSQLISQHR